MFKIITDKIFDIFIGKKQKKHYWEIIKEAEKVETIKEEEKMEAIKRNPSYKAIVPNYDKVQIGESFFYHTPNGDIKKMTVQHKACHKNRCYALIDYDNIAWISGKSGQCFLVEKVEEVVKEEKKEGDE